MKKKYNVLILGIGQSNFLDQLYGALKNQDDSIEFEVNGHFDISRGSHDKRDNIYKAKYDFENIIIKNSDLLLNFVNFLFTRFFWQVILFEFSQKSNYKLVYRQLIQLTKAKARVSKLIKPIGAEVIHFHFCVPENVRELYFLDRNTSTICTFWGSDLLRETGVSNVFYIKKALERTNLITVQTPELSEILLSKYGRKFQNKVRSLRFVLNKEIFNNIDKFRFKRELIFDFKQKYGIPKNKLVAVLGHNAFEENNHLKILNELYQLSTEYTNDWVLILHLAYGGKDHYINRLRLAANELKSLNILIIDDFLNSQETALLRLSTDLLIHLPVSDALSAAMTETLYAGNSVITGGWLPYGILMRNKISFLTIENISELGHMFKRFNIEKNQIVSKNINNSGAISALLLSEDVNLEWLKLFAEVQKSHS